MKIIGGAVSCVVDDKEILVISKEYTGSPLIAHRPDLILISESTYIKHKDKILQKEKIQIQFL